MLKKLGLGLVGLIATASVAAWAAGAFNGFPIVGDTTGATVCLSYGNNGVCNQYSPAGPADVPAGSVVPADTQSATGQPFTVLIPYNSLGGNTTVNTTTGTGQNPIVAAGVSNYIYAGNNTATFATITLPAAPVQNQKFCIYNAGAGILTLTSIVATGKTFVGTTPTSIPVGVASGAQTTVTNAGVCWLYYATTSSWYRIL